jgi:hypothetical protein
MSRDWRLYFSLLILLTFAMPILPFVTAHPPVTTTFVALWLGGWWACMWLLVGALIVFVVGAGREMPWAVRWRVGLLWLPAIWSGKVRDWCQHV